MCHRLSFISLQLPRPASWTTSALVLSEGPLVSICWAHGPPLTHKAQKRRPLESRGRLRQPHLPPFSFPITGGTTVSSCTLSPDAHRPIAHRATGSENRFQPSSLLCPTGARDASPPRDSRLAWRVGIILENRLAERGRRHRPTASLANWAGDRCGPAIGNTPRALGERLLHSANRFRLSEPGRVVIQRASGRLIVVGPVAPWTA